MEFDQFFQAMPESVKGIPCSLEPLSLTGDEDFDLIMVAWQPGFFHLQSLPMHFSASCWKKILRISLLLLL
jgi:hypothetical protein